MSTKMSWRLNLRVASRLGRWYCRYHYGKDACWYFCFMGSLFALVSVLMGCMLGFRRRLGKGVEQ